MKIRRFLILCLTAAMLSSFCGMAARAEGEDMPSLPERYDLRELGLVTEVKDQGKYGTCWAFAIANVLESNALVRGYGKYDLSEYQMAYLCTHILSASGSMTEGEGPTCQEHWLNGPYGGILSSSLLQGYAIQSEEDYPYSKVEEPLPEDGVSIDGVLYVDSCYTVPASDTEAMKTLLMKNGALYMCVHAKSWIDEELQYCDWSTGAVYYPGGNAKYQYIDHFISIVGWDDTYSKDHFRITPPGDGAWIIKNSWGTKYGDAPVTVGDEVITSCGDGGFYYISYYDVSFNYMNSATSITVNRERNYDRIYQYDGGVGLQQVNNVTDVLIRFSAEEDGAITGVRIKPTGRLGKRTFFCGDWTFDPAAATIRVYQGGFDAASAEAGEPVYTQESVIVYPDYQTVGFDREVAVSKGEEYCVRVTFDRPIYYALDGKQTLYWSYENAAGGSPGETYLKIERSKGAAAWYDTSDVPGVSVPCSACIKVLTKDRLSPPDDGGTPATELPEPGAENEDSPASDPPAGAIPVWLLPVIGVSAVGAGILILWIAKKRKKTGQ